MTSAPACPPTSRGSRSCSFDCAREPLGDDGRCTAYDERPLVCRGYPWYGAPPRDMPLADPECGYLVDVPGRGTPK